MFSFIGRGVCKHCCTWRWSGNLAANAEGNVVYIFIGSIIMGDNWWKYTSGSIIVLTGIGYVALEYIPSIEPPANMRYAAREC